MTNITTLSLETLSHINTFITSNGDRGTARIISRKVYAAFSENMMACPILALRPKAFDILEEISLLTEYAPSVRTLCGDVQLWPVYVDLLDYDKHCRMVMTDRVRYRLADHDGFNLTVTRLAGIVNRFPHLSNIIFTDSFLPDYYEHGIVVRGLRSRSRPDY